MPRKIHPRESIHTIRDSKTPQPETFDKENNTPINTQDQANTESDPKEFEDNNKIEQQKYKRENASPQPESTKSSSQKNVLFIFVIVAIIAMCIYKPTKSEMKCSFEKLKGIYSNQNRKLWRTLEVGIESILNERTTKPAVYLFINYGGDHDKLIKDIVKHSSDCYGNGMRPIEMKSTDFSTEDDYGLAIKKFKSKIEKGKVMLIVNLNKIPAGAARALHTICDTHSPISKDVVIFLTLTISSTMTDSNDAVKAEDTLRELWGSKLKNNELDALITRVTDQVIAFQS